MESSINLKEPNKINVSVTLTMQFHEWKTLYDALEKANTRGKTPIWEMRELLEELIQDLDSQCIIKYSKRTK